MEVHDILSLCLSSAALFVSLLAIYVSFSRLARDYTNPRWRMQDEFDEKNNERKIFMTELRDVFGQYKEDGDISKLSIDGKIEVEELVRKAGFPPRLLECNNIRYYDPVFSNDFQIVLWDFAHWIYPFEGYTSKYAPSNKPNRESINDARSKLGAFWDTWASRICASKITRTFPKEKEVLLWLTWLDAPHRKHWEVDDPGKKKMFHLANLYCDDKASWRSFN